jgi:hypothetical protein
MKRLIGIVVVALVGVSTAWGQTAKPTKSDAEIKQQIVRESIASYSGSCPCPYNTDRAGRSCGRRSAYSRPGGASPACYAEDVTTKMVDDYRAAHGEKKPPVTRTKVETTEKPRNNK